MNPRWNQSMTKALLRRFTIGCFLVGLGVLLSYVFFIEWVKLYPQDYDPKNIEYVLWKHGLNQNMNLDHALGGMTHDTWAVKLVQGKTKEQLTERFGTIRTYNQARPYDQYCANFPETVGELGVHAKGKEVVMLRDSDWLVILDKGKAVDLVLCKGL
jgi:hypothetical protein